MQRVILGCLKYKPSSDLALYIHEPNSEDLFEAQNIYVEVFEEALMDGAMTEGEILNFMQENYLWTEMNEYDLTKGIPKTIDDLKVEIYNNFLDEMSLLVLRTNLKYEQEKLNKLYSLKHQYDHLTCNGIAAFMKNYYLFENCTKLKGKKDYDWSGCSVIKVMNFKNSQLLSDSTLRSISKYDQWKALWQTAKKNGQLFNCSSVDMTDEQRRLTFWSMFYDNVYEHHESPPEEIINDDDAIDGWAILQRREREKEKGAKDIDKKLGGNKIRNAQEVFVVAKNPKHAKTIEDLNSPRVKALKQARMNQLNKNGDMQEFDFADVKQKLYMEAVNKGNEIMKGGR